MYAGLAKLRALRAFCVAVGDLTRLTAPLDRILALAVIGAELALGSCLIFGVILATSLWMCLAMILAMMVVSRNKDTSTTDTLCLCFGQDGVLANSWKSFARSTLLLIGTGSALVMTTVYPDIQSVPISLEVVALALGIVLLCAWITDIEFTKRVPR